MDPGAVGLWDPESHVAALCTVKRCSECFWKTHGRRLMETTVATSPDGTQRAAWLFQTKSGLGCRLCSLRYNTNSLCMPSTRDSHTHRKAHFELGTVRAKYKANLQDHGTTRRLVLAVANFFGAEPIIKLAPNTLADALPSGVPTPKD